MPLLWVLSALPVNVAWAWAFLFAAADLCVARTVGSVAGTARSAACRGLGALSGGSGHTCAFGVGQGPMDVRLLAIVAGLVPGGNGAVAALLGRALFPAPCARGWLRA